MIRFLLKIIKIVDLLICLTVELINILQIVIEYTFNVFLDSKLSIGHVKDISNLAIQIYNLFGGNENYSLLMLR